jgi:hypothetical protein
MSEPAPQPRKWRKRLIWALAILVVARIAIAITVPVTIRKVAAKHDLDCTWQSLSLSLLGGSVELKGLELRPKAPRDTQPPPAPIARIESVEADVAMLDLLRLHPHVVVAAIDGVELHVARAETGAWNFERHLPRAEPAATEAPAPEASEPAAYDLALPVEIDALRAHDVVVFVDDRGVTPAVKARCELNANAWHLGADDRPGRFDAVVTCPGVLDAATVVGELTTAETKAGARLEARLAGLQPRTLGGWLAAFGVTPRADRLSCAMVAELSAETIGPERRAL